MSNEKRSFFQSGWYLTLVIFFALMLVLGATSTIWQIVSKQQHNGVSMAFNYISAYDAQENKCYVFSACDPKTLPENTVVLYNQSAESGKVEYMLGTLKTFMEDENFGEVLLTNNKTGEDVILPATYVLGQLSSQDYFSCILVSLLNSSLMLYLFTIFPLVMLVVLWICRVFASKNNSSKPHKLSKRQQQLAKIGSSNK